ncbi:MAG TPA: hypothetical protein VK557_15095 [Pyrinomonadaceae bacterium]|nr:hypothetical protein [Pyrinomonadaceae bacterium]
MAKAIPSLCALLQNHETHSSELNRKFAVAGNASNCNSGLDDRVSKKVQKELGILVVSREQCFMDRLGTQRRRICPGRFAALSCFPEYQGCREEPWGRCMIALMVSWLNPTMNTIESSS